MDADSNISLKIAAKPLQMGIWLLFTAYRNSLLPTPYDIPFSHNARVTDRQTTDKQRDTVG